MAGKERAVPLLCLDIDGTVRQGLNDALGKFVNGPVDVRVFPEAVELMRRWKARNGRIIGVSNQGGVALGHVTLLSVIAAMHETHFQCEQLFDKMLWCIHHPAATDPEYARCWCRKPRIGLIVEGALELGREHGEFYPPYMALMVGDRQEDRQCAENAGLDFMWAAQWRAQAGKGT